MSAMPASAWDVGDAVLKLLGIDPKSREITGFTLTVEYGDGSAKIEIRELAHKPEGGVEQVRQMFRVEPMEASDSGKFDVGDIMIPAGVPMKPTEQWGPGPGGFTIKGIDVEKVPSGAPLVESESKNRERAMPEPFRTDPRRFTVIGDDCFDEWGMKVGRVVTETYPRPPKEHWPKLSQGEGPMLEFPAQRVVQGVKRIEFFDQRFISSAFDVVYTGGSMAEPWHRVGEFEVRDA